MGSLKLAETSATPADPDRGNFPSQRWWAGVVVLGGVPCAAFLAISVEWFTAAVVVVASVGVGWADVRWRRIPNAVTASLVIVAMLFGAVSSEAKLVDVGVGALLTCVPALGLHLVNPRWVGFGDVKLLFAVGAILGVLWWPAGVGVLWLAMAAALVSRPFVPASWRRSIPFGLWVSAAAAPVSIFLAGSVVS